MFKDNYEIPKKQARQHIEIQDTPRLSLQTQWENAKAYWPEKPPQGIRLHQAADAATTFTRGRFSNTQQLFINPYSGAVHDTYKVKETDMYLIRKLHGELLLGSWGTKIVELVASWLIVLLLTGLYLFWPRKGNWRALVRIRRNMGRRIFYRDLHSVLGFWSAGLLLLILAGGLPWTDVFGAGFKWVQTQTDTGFPSTWTGRGIEIETPAANMPPLSLDSIVARAETFPLKGIVELQFPQHPKGAYRLGNATTDLHNIQALFLDPYTGKVIQTHTWEDIGIMLKARFWVMAFHQGQFGWWNWLLVFATALALVVLSVAGWFSFQRRGGRLTELQVPPRPKMGKSIVALIVILSVLLPLFGLSVLCLTLVYIWKERHQKVA